MKSLRSGMVVGVVAVWVWLFLLVPAGMAAKRKCPPFHLKTEDGKIINPLSGENADQPYSPRQTCGACN